MQASIPLMPESASTVSGDVDALYFYLSGVTVFFTLLIAGVIIFFVIRYRRRNPFEIPRPIEGSMKLETLWSVIPLLIAMSFFVWGASLFYRQYRPPANALEVYVIGKQWMWKVQQPTGLKEINELHLPVGRNVRLVMASEDVIHDFSIPAFRVKMDVMPGHYNTMWFRPTKPGRYRLYCSQYCGTNHALMGGWVTVMEAADYAAWLSGSPTDANPLVAGEKLFADKACVTCHLSDGKGRAPSLNGVYGANVLLADGTTVTADDTYIRESILQPMAKLVAGYQPLMPTFQGQLTEEQILALTAYIKSLEKLPPPKTGAGMAPVTGNK